MGDFNTPICLKDSIPPQGMRQIGALSLWKCISDVYLAKSFSSHERLACFLKHYEYLLDRLGQERFQILLADDLLLWAQDPYWITAKMEHVISNEGELTLHFKKGNKALYGLSFSFVPAAVVTSGDQTVGLLSRMQGRAGEAVSIKNAAKQMGDITPQSALYFALLGTLQYFKVIRLFGVSATNQVCQTPKFERLFSKTYNDFYEDNGALSISTGFYDLPMAGSEKPLTVIAPWHRRRVRLKRAAKLEIAAAVSLAWAREDGVSSSSLDVTTRQEDCSAPRSTSPTLASTTPS